MQKISKLIVMTMLVLSAWVQAAEVSSEEQLAIELNWVDSRGQTPLMRACWLNQESEVQRLLEPKKVGTSETVVNVNMQDKDGNTPIQIACWRGNNLIVQMLLAIRKSGGNELLVDVNKQNVYGNTALITLCYGHFESPTENFCDNFQQLLKHGANILLRNKKGESALDLIDLPLFKKEMKAVFDALQEQVKLDEVQDAYRAFQEGKPAKLQEFMKQYRCQQQDLSGHSYQSFIPNHLVSQDVSQHVDKFYGIKEQMAHFFKTESIKPLLQWLINVARDESTQQGLVDVLRAVEGK